MASIQTIVDGRKFICDSDGRHGPYTTEELAEIKDAIERHLDDE